MTIELNLKQVIVDNPDLIKKGLKEGDNWKIHLYNGTDDDGKEIGVFLEKDNRGTIMFNLTEKEALFLSKSLITILESI